MSSDDTIYFDHAATTPIAPEVLNAMMPYLKDEYGNASSVHNKGLNAKVAIEEAREKVAGIINAEPSEIVFTSGGTESDNAAIFGTILAADGRNEIISSSVEHHAVLNACQFSALYGGNPEILDPDRDGRIIPDQLKPHLGQRTLLVSLMHVNNETGTVNPVKEIAALCHENGVLFHTDAVQSAGKLPVDVKEMGVDLLSMSGHKLYGPKGIGILYVKNGTPWVPWMRGGAQERNRRGGTSNTPAIAGFAKALELMSDEMDQNYKHCMALREELLAGLSTIFGDKFQINGSPELSTPYIINIGFIPPDDQIIDGEMLLLNLDVEGFSVSSGSACTSGAVEPSHVLTGIGVPEKIIYSSLRLSFGKSNTKKQVGILLKKLKVILDRMYAVS